MAGLEHLPIDDFLPEILDLFSKNKNLVVTASPGAGKTTRLPPALAKAVRGQVLVLEPRRMAAVAAAARIAEENGWTAGREVGWQVRFENQTSSETRLVFMTEALLARRLLSDPELKGVDAIVLDEFHERSLHVDLALGLLKEMQELGRDVKLVVMSATLQAEPISRFLGDAPIVSVPGRLFPLEVLHQKESQLLQTSPMFFDRVAASVREAAAKTKGDVLVFLPGLGEIERTRERLESWAATNAIDMVPLHGSLTLDQQRRALRPGPRRRVVLSTNIAESSVTVDGVDAVVDTGLSKSGRFDLRTGFSRLELGRISLSSATQRSGRAARQKPGFSLRLWNKADELSMPKVDPPEIQRSDLAEALLFLSQNGVADFGNFSWFEAPAAPLIAAAEKSLRAMDALDSGSRITELGRKLLRWPLPPRLGRLCLTSVELGCPTLGAKAAAILQEKDYVSNDRSKSHWGDKLECDLTLRLHLLPELKPRQTLAAAEQIERMVLREAGGAAKKSGDEDALLRRLLLSAFPDRLCRRRAGDRGSGGAVSDRGLMVGGRGVKLAPESTVRESEFFIALSGMEGLSDAETKINLACGLDKDFVLRELGAKVERRKELFFDDEKNQLFRREARFYQDLPLDEPSLSPPSADEIQAHIPELLQKRFKDVLERNEELGRWFARWNYYAANRPDDAVEWTPEKIRDVFTAASFGEKSLEAVIAKSLVYFFEQELPAGARDRFNGETPDRIKVPSGNTLKVQYPDGREPYLEVRLQEVFGWSQTPKLLGGAKNLTLHLLGPNYRPVQVTADLSSFWKNAYPGVRKEMRARYPKHSWPEDPLTAPAVAKGRPQK